MSRLDDLMAQCVAAPDSDAPRLVWADAVGGERGELVVLQCRLASGGITNRDKWRALRARERELLAANGAEWSELADESPRWCVFRRGFVEALEIVCSYDTRLDAIVAKVPLVRSLANHLVDSDDQDFARLVANPRSSQLSALRISASDRAIQYVVGHNVALRALSVERCSAAAARQLADCGLLSSVERLALGEVEGIAQLLAATPRLRALDVRGSLARYASMIPPTVVELACQVSGDLDDLATLPIASTIARLRVNAMELTPAFDALAAFTSLRSLDLSLSKPARHSRPFDMHPAGLLRALRELSLGMWCEPSSVAAIARVFGPQLDTLHWTGGIPGDPIKASQALLVAGDPSIAAHVDGEFVVGLRPPWARRPLLYGDDLRSPWFDGVVRG